MKRVTMKANVLLPLTLIVTIGLLVIYPARAEVENVGTTASIAIQPENIVE